MSQTGCEKMIQLLEKQFSPTLLNVIDESHKHIGHQGNQNNGGHYKVEIISDKFEGMNAIQKHRLIYQCLEDMIPIEIHALSIDAKPIAES